MPLVDTWPSGGPRILVADAWLANAGDGAIALVTQQRLERLAPHASIVHAAYQGDLLAGRYPELALVPPLAGLLGVTPAIPEMRGWVLEAGRALVAGADVVLSQGGGFAMEHYDPWERLRAWELVVEMGLPIGFGAQSVGHFARDRERATLRRVYGAAEVIAVRETHSRRNVIELGAPPERVLVTADEVFGMARPRVVQTAAPRRGLAYVLSAHPQQREDGTWAPALSPRDLGGLASGLLRMVDGEHVTFLSTQQGLGALGRGLEDDADLSRRVLASMPGADAARIRVLDGYLSANEIASAVATHRGLVTMRMHAAIIALAHGVPVSLLNESFKVTSMFEMLGLRGVLEPGGHLDRRGLPELDVAVARAAANDDVVLRLLAGDRLTVARAAVG